ncbi:MAG: TIGR03862 family flavoprotein [Pseudomonadota bacterium]
MAVIGSGPAGLAAAEVLAMRGFGVCVYDAMPSPARKFLMAGKSGLNLTKDEDPRLFRDHIGSTSLNPVLSSFGPEAVISWAEGLGQKVFVGSSGRVFPRSMKASPLLRQWLQRLTDHGVSLRTRWRWTGWTADGALSFETPDGPQSVRTDATVLALGGASWPRLGSDAAWLGIVRDIGVPLEPFRPANMGFDVDWSERFRDRWAGAPVKPAGLRYGDQTVRGEFVVSKSGVEGSAIYAISAPLRDALERGPTAVLVDLVPDHSNAALSARLSRPRRKASWSNFLRKTTGLSGVRAALAKEMLPSTSADPGTIASQLKSLPIPLVRPRPVAEAISSAGGIAWEAVTSGLMLKRRPGTFVAGEMLDWEAPTGGYLITTCLATGRWAGAAAADWVEDRSADGGAIPEVFQGHN